MTNFRFGKKPFCNGSSHIDAGDITIWREIRENHKRIHEATKDTPKWKKRCRIAKAISISSKTRRKITLAGE